MTMRVMFTDMMQKGKFCKRTSIIAARLEKASSSRHAGVPKHLQPFYAASARLQTHGMAAAGNRTG